jgi:hypothetical protein
MTHRTLRSIVIIATTGITALSIGAATAAANPATTHVRVVADAAPATPTPAGAEWG